MVATMRRHHWLAPIVAVAAAGMFQAVPASGHIAVRAAMHADLMPSTPGASLPAPASGLPQRWCGERRADDDTDNEFGSTRLRKIKVVYAVPADVEPRQEIDDAIQATVGEMLAFVGSESGGRRSIRFDLGTSCGPGFVDILTLKLPQPLVYYEAGCFQGTLGYALQTQLRSRPDRNHVVFVPDLICGPVAGWAEIAQDDEPGPSNEANTGGRLAVAFNLLAETPLHEIVHTLGAVNHSAPHSDQLGHCYDIDDLMCYGYGRAAPGGTPVLHPCPDQAPISPLDCNKDDYFNPDPAPGSHLARNWNVYNSAFLCPLSECTPQPPLAQAGEEPPGPPAFAPKASDCMRGASLTFAPATITPSTRRVRVKVSRRLTRATVELRRAGRRVARARITRARTTGLRLRRRAPRGVRLRVTLEGRDATGCRVSARTWIRSR